MNSFLENQVGRAYKEVGCTE